MQWLGAIPFVLAAIAWGVASYSEADQRHRRV